MSVLLFTYFRKLHSIAQTSSYRNSVCRCITRRCLKWTVLSSSRVESQSEYPLCDAGTRSWRVSIRRKHAWIWIPLLTTIHYWLDCLIKFDVLSPLNVTLNQHTHFTCSYFFALHVYSIYSQSYKLNLITQFKQTKSLQIDIVCLFYRHHLNYNVTYTYQCSVWNEFQCDHYVSWYAELKRKLNYRSGNINGLNRTECLSVIYMSLYETW